MAELLPLPWPAIAAGMVVTFVAALLQGTIGFGFAICSVSILSLIDPRLAPVPQMLVILPLTLAMALRERHAIEWRSTVWVLAGRLPGAYAGVALLTVATPHALDLFIGTVVLIAAVVVSTGAHIVRKPPTEFIAGFVSSVSGVVSAIGGPPIALLYGGSKGPTLRASLAAIFVVGAILHIGTRALAQQISLTDGHVALFLLPPLLLGFKVSRRLHGKVEGRPLKIAVLVVASLAAVGLLVRGAWGLVNG